MEYYYLLIFIFVLLLIFKVYVKITYKFWAYQPVFHHYNIFYWIYPCGIINEDLPKVNKFCNFTNIVTKEFHQYTKNELEDIMQLIQCNYYRSREANYLPTLESFSSYFIGHNSKTYISTYFDKTFIMDEKNSTIIKDKSIIGIITGRPLNITLKNKPSFKVYYVDYLCVDKEHRNKDIAPQLIQTYEYTQRHSEKNCSVSLFKREGKLTGIVPLCVYNTYQFDISSIIKVRLSQDSMQLIEINKLNIRLLIELITNKRNEFECFILPDFSNLLNLINNNTYKIYGILEKDTLLACYCFRNSFMSYNLTSLIDTNKKSQIAVEFFASINNCDHKEIFINGFTLAVYKYSKKNKADLVTIENIGHNNIITNELFSQKICSKFESPTAYFYYNYAKYPILPEQAFILS